MFCRECGKEIDKGSKFCEFCGAEIGYIKENEQRNEQTSEILVESAKEQIQEKNVGAETNAEPENSYEQSCAEVHQTVTKEKLGEVSTSVQYRDKAFSNISIICIIVAFVVGSLVSGILTYNIGAKPVLEKMVSAEEMEKEAKKKLDDASKVYAEINNIEVQTGEPQVTKLQGNSTVGIDIAPGLYTMEGSDRDVAFYHVYSNGDEAFLWEKNGTEILLKAGEKLEEMDEVTTFTPVEEE